MWVYLSSKRPSTAFSHASHKKRGKTKGEELSKKYLLWPWLPERPRPQQPWLFATSLANARLFWGFFALHNPYFSWMRCDSGGSDSVQPLNFALYIASKWSGVRSLLITTRRRASFFGGYFFRGSFTSKKGSLMVSWPLLFNSVRTYISTRSTLIPQDPVASSSTTYKHCIRHN